MNNGGDMKRNRISILLMLIFSLESFSLDLNINSDIEIPDICRELPSATLPTDLSPICLSAQLAAQSFPPLLPSANQLCMVLEGITAEIGVFQIQINTIYDICDTALAEIETQMMMGVNEYNLISTDTFSLLEKLSNVSNVEDLYFESVQRNNGYLGEDEDQWMEILENTQHPEIQYSSINYFQKVSGAEYLGKSTLENNNQNLIVKTLQDEISETTTLKQSQDLAARMAGELAFQQNVFSQLIAEYLELESAQAMKELTQERWYQNLLKKRDEP